jgi:small subunit ribosomal protein S16
MPTRMRLQRHGKKGYAFYHIVIADGRAPRDGRFIEKIGTYNPNTNPASIDLDFDKAMTWLKNGAQPTDTVNAILKYKGVAYRYHLAKGVQKGAFTEEQAEAKYTAWLDEKQNRIQKKVEGLGKAAADAAKKQFEAEKAKSDARAASIAARNAVVVEEPTEEAAAEGEATEETQA